MSRIHVCRGVIPQISKNLNQLELITLSGPATGTFDPSITTSLITTITCDYGDGTSETLTGTAHAFSHTYAVLGKWLAIFHGAPLNSITAIDIASDVVTSNVSNFKKLCNLSTLTATTNSGMRGLLSSISQCTYILFTDAQLYGSPLDLNRAMTYLYLNGSRISGKLSDCPTSLTLQFRLNAYSGYIICDSFPACYGVRNVDFRGLCNTEVDVDAILNSIYQQRHSFTYATPDLKISSTHAPSGSYVNPTTTPGDGNSDCNWAWVTDHHEPLSGYAQIYYLKNGPDHGTDTFSRWTISYD